MVIGIEEIVVVRGIVVVVERTIKTFHDRKPMIVRKLRILEILRETMLRNFFTNWSFLSDNPR